MIEIENTQVYNLTRAIYSVRNAMNSWDRSDSDLENDIPGENDLFLAKRLVNAGTEHRKFMRQIMVTMDITAPLYLWKELDTYKVGTTANSCSTMHKLTARELKVSDFSMDGMSGEGSLAMIQTVDTLNRILMACKSTKNPAYWRDLILLLPESYNQKRTWTANYEVLMRIYEQRKGHKLTEWGRFRRVIESLPYMDTFLKP